MSVHALAIDTDCEELPDGSLLLRVRGELDLAAVPFVERALSQCARNGGVRLLVDLSDVSFIDAAGLRVLNEYDARLRNRGGELLLSRPSWQVRYVLKKMGGRCRLRIAPA